MSVVFFSIDSCIRHELILFAVFQTVGGAFSTSMGQAVFVNRLLGALPRTAPSVSPALVLATGASELQKVVPPESLPGVLAAYMLGLKAAFTVAIAFSGVAFLSSLAIPMEKLPSHTQQPEIDSKVSTSDD